MEEYVYANEDFLWSRSRRSENPAGNDPTVDWRLNSDDVLMGLTTTSSGLDNNTIANATETATNTTITKPYFYQKGQLTFLILLFVLIVVGNVSVLVAISLSKKRKSRMNFFIMHLAFADLTSGIATVLPDIIWKSTVQWYADTSLCKIFKYLQGASTFGSTYVLVALSIDRLDAIARPMNFSGSGTRAKILVGVAWGLSLLLSLPLLVLHEVGLTKRNHRQCFMRMPPWGWQLYLTLLSVVIFIIPAVIICACYSIIVNIIWRKSNTGHAKPPKQTTKFTRRNGHSQNGAHQTEYRSQESHTSGRGVIPKARIKTIKMTLVIVFAFVVCWSPYFVFNLLSVYHLIPNTLTMQAVSTFVQSLSSLNSGVNSIIYCLFSTRICQNWRRLPYCDWFARTFFSCCTTDGSTNAPPGFGTSGTEFTSVVTDGRGHSRAVNNGRRHSGTPYVKVTLSEKDNEILLRHIKTPEHKSYINNGDVDNISENISSV